MHWELSRHYMDHEIIILSIRSIGSRILTNNWMTDYVTISGYLNYSILVISGPTNA
jgi:hypothetical protein